MTRLDKISSLCLALFALGIMIQSYKLSLGSLSQPGPGFFPFWAGGILGTISLLIFVKALLIYENRPESFWPGKAGIRKIIFTVIALLFYAFALDYLGTFLCTFLVMLFLLKGIEPQKWVTAIAFSILTSVLSYLLFATLMQSQLPKGFIEKFLGV